MPNALSAALRRADARNRPQAPDAPYKYVDDPALPASLNQKRRRLFSWLKSFRSPHAMSPFFSYDVCLLSRENFTKFLDGSDRHDIDMAYGWYKDLASFSRESVDILPPFSDPNLDSISALGRSLNESFNGTDVNAPNANPTVDEQPQPPSNGDFGNPTEWLFEVCKRLERYNNDGTVLLAAKALFTEIANIVSSRKSDDEIQLSLFDLLGADGFDDIIGIIQRRSLLRDAFQQTSVSSASDAAVPHSMLSVTSESSKQRHRKNRQQQRKQTRKTGTNIHVVAEQPANDEHCEEDFITAFRNADFGTGFQKRTLGEDVIREHFEGWEQVMIPAKTPLPRSEYESELKSITEIDIWARPAFSGVTQFNRMQSRCLGPAYSTNENLLVCAPTGAGKTNVALLCILHEVKQHVGSVLRDNHVPIGSLTADLFKIVYIAPMKALAQEIVEKFSRALRFLGLKVKELTGDMQLSQREIEETHIIVTTPEKWDVITRKSNDLIGFVRLLIFDEVHILHDTRGSVIEVLVARTVRQVESSQSMIRIVGLSATLPNYGDVATFLRVNPEKGLLAFDPTYRPVPLQQTFIGITHPNSVRRQSLLNEICHQKLIEALLKGYQVMIFVHSRKDTIQTAQAMIELSQQDDTLNVIESATNDTKYVDAKSKFARCSNHDLRYLSTYGIGIHNAGMFRHDRALVESMFEQGVLRILVTTATLAWGVNLPAHTVIIKGTQIYSAPHGGYIDLSMLDVMQIFGRAGRPQYDTSGEGIIITQGDALPRYLRLFVHAMPIESKLTETLVDNLNAEINLGTVTNIAEAQRWISYTYLYIRMQRNPQHYGINYQELLQDPTLAGHRRSLVDAAVRRLIECRMLVVPAQSDVFMPTDLGRIASFFYISHASIEVYLKILNPNIADDNVILKTLASSVEFVQIKVRNEEINELDELRNSSCPIPVKSLDTPQDKVTILLQAYISRHRPTMSSLVSDTNYIIQSAGRICRALYEITMKRGWSHVCLRFLAFCKMIERQMWDWETPLRQFPSGSGVTIPDELAYEIEQRNLTFSTILSMKDRVEELSQLLPSVRHGPLVLRAARFIPRLGIHWHIQPINATVCKISIRFEPDFVWSDRLHGSMQGFRFLAFEADSYDRVHHAEEVSMRHEDYIRGELSTEFYVSVPSQEALPTDLFVSVDSDLWLGSETATRLNFDGVVIPPENFGHTPLLDLHPLPVSALQNARFERLYQFGQFNTVQTQCFHMLYHGDSNVLLGAPTGSGKTIVAEVAILKLLRDSPQKSAVYIAPLKALARERLINWRRSLGGILGLKVVEITGGITVSSDELRRAQVVVTTPEKFDSLSRRWRDRSYVRQVGLVVIDEIHLLGAERGPILEVIVSRLHFMSSVTGDKVRIIGLSTSLANADDVSDWMDIDSRALYNFHPVVRPTPLSVHISGFPGSRHYCPRMQMLNKPTYASIMAYAHDKPALVFVSSRRQTRLTALGLISLTVADGDPHKFVRMERQELSLTLETVSDDCLRHVLEFGIGLHHAGLCDSDRRLVESLFEGGQIQVLVCTSTLAWGVNLPAHLVVIKGTEYFDPNRRRYVDYPITDVIQMAGRAGRPQFRDSEAHAVVLVHESKKVFYKKFLFEPFPVESSLLGQLHDHINAEIQSGQISSIVDAVDYLSWTFLFRRLCKNPTYYGLRYGTVSEIRSFLLRHLQGVFIDLRDAGCIKLEDERVSGTDDGLLSADFYLRYRTVKLMRSRLSQEMTLEQILHLVCECEEFAQVPVRHNEDQINKQWAPNLLWQSATLQPISPHLKAFLLLQAHMQRAPVPINDYTTDTNTVLEQSARVIQALLSLAASMRLGRTAMNIVRLLQCLKERRQGTEPFASVLPIPDQTARWIERRNDLHFADLVIAAHTQSLPRLLRGAPYLRSSLQALSAYLQRLPALEMTYSVQNNCDLLVQIRQKFPGVKTEEDVQWWLGVISSDTGELLSWRRVADRFPFSITIEAVLRSDRNCDIELHLVSENFCDLELVEMIRV